MTRKEIIINHILGNTNLPEIYNLTFEKLSRMYDNFETAKKMKVHFDKFLVEAGAMNAKKEIRRDLEVEYYDKDQKKTIKSKIVLKYPIYTAMESKWQELKWDRQDKERDALNNLTDENKSSFLEAFGKDDPEVKKQAELVFGEREINENTNK